MTWSRRQGRRARRRRAGRSLVAQVPEQAGHDGQPSRTLPSRCSLGACCAQAGYEWGTQIVGRPSRSAKMSLGSEPPRLAARGPLAGAALDRGRGPADPGVVRGQPGGAGLRAQADADLAEAGLAQVFAHMGFQRAPVRADHEAQLAPRRGLGRDGVDRLGRIAGAEGQHVQAVPAEHLSEADRPGSPNARLWRDRPRRRPRPARPGPRPPPAGWAADAGRAP